MCAAREWAWLTLAQLQGALVHPGRIHLLVFILAAAASSSLCAAECSFWVWNRADPLTVSEIATLRAAGIRRLYWQAGELEARPDGNLFLRRTAPTQLWMANPPENQPQLVPVVRVSTTIRSPETFTGDALGRALTPVAAASPDGSVQLDFDCPDRLLPIYAERLHTARRIAGIRHLSITALDHWADAPARAALWTEVDEVFPMIYDVEKDGLPGPDGLAAWEPQPVLDPVKLRARLASWRRCPIPWHAGLPAFARVTIYDAGGRSLGHLRTWNWDDLVFNPALRLDRPPHLGTTLLRAGAATRLGETAVPAGGFVAARRPERPGLRTAIAAAAAAAARSVVLFRLPDPPEDQDGGWSLAQLTGLFAAPLPAVIEAPRLRLSRADDGTGRLVLCNDSDTDLPPRFGETPGDPAHRGYTLEIDAPGPVWREALAGDFQRVNGHRFTGAAATDPPGSAPVRVTIPLATRLTFWFSQLPAHATLGTGLLQMAPNADPATVRYRVADSTDDSASWQPLP